MGRRPHPHPIYWAAGAAGAAAAAGAPSAAGAMAGWAAAACAGVVAGVGLTTHVTADERADAVLYQSTLVEVDDTEVLG